MASLPALPELNKSGFSGCGRLRGGAGRTRTNHQSVMEHGWCPTNYPGRTPIRIAGRFAVLLDFPGFLMLDQPPKRYGTWFEFDQLPWSDTLEPTTKVLSVRPPRDPGTSGHASSNRVHHTPRRGGA